MDARLNNIVFIVPIILMIGLICCSSASAKISSVTTSSPIAGFNTTTAPQFIFNVSGNYSANYSCKLLLNGSIYATNASVLNNTATNLTNNTITNGTFTWLINCSDIDGYNTSTLLTLTIDGIPPSIAFDASTSMQSGNYSKNYTYVNVTASDSLVGLASINITLYNSTGGLKASNYSTSSPLYINFTALADGIYYVNATAKDYLNNTNYTSTMIIVLDNAVPSLTVFSPSAGYFNSRNITVNFTANDTLMYKNTTITVYNSTGSAVNSTVSTVAGNQSVNLSVLMDGTYYINITVSDGAGNVNKSQISGIIIDTVKPSLVVNSPTPSTYLNVSQITINLTVGVGDTSFNYTNITIYNSSGIAVNSTINTTNGTYVISLGVPSNGNYTLNATARDFANNINLSSVQSVIVDTVAPVISSTAPATNAHFNTQSVNYTLSEAVASAVIVFTRTGGSADGIVHNCSLQGTALNSSAHNNLTLATGVNACVSWTNALVDGANYTVTFNAVDFASNNAATVANTNVVYDITAPALTAVHIQSNNTNNISLARTGDSINMTFAASKSLQTPIVVIAGHTATVTGSGASWAANYTMAGGDTEGVIAFAINYSDTVGNNGSTVNTTTDSSNIIFDSTSPAITGTYSGSGWQASASIALNASDAGSMASGISRIFYNFDGGAWTNISSNVTTASISSSGNHTIYYYSIDNAGNIGSTKNTTNILVDVTAPTIVISGLAGNGSIYTFDVWSNNTASVNLTGSDNVPGSGYNRTYYCNDTINTCMPSTIYTSPLNITASGITYIRFYGVDNMNNSGSVAYKRVMILKNTQTFLNQSTTVTTNQTMIVVQGNNTAANITVPSTITNATLDISENLNVSTGNATLAGLITIVANTSSAGIITVQLPAGITVSGNVSVWNGTINMLQVKSVSTVSPADSGYTASVSKVIEVGADSVELVLNKAVRINLSGEGGKMVGWSRGSTTVNKITNVCAVDSQAWADANVSADSECVYDYGAGSDIILWTKHFTSFVTYTETVTPAATTTASHPSSSSSSGGVILDTDPSIDMIYSPLPIGTTVMALNETDIPFTELSVTTNANISNARIIFTVVSMPSTNYTGSIVYRYLQVDHDAVADAKIDGAKMKFSVAKSWLTTNSIDENNVVLARYADDTWVILKTALYSEDDASAYYEADSPGLSLFAITEAQPSTLQPAVEPITQPKTGSENTDLTTSTGSTKLPAEKNHTLSIIMTIIMNTLLIMMAIILMTVVFWYLLGHKKSSHNKEVEDPKEDHHSKDETHKENNAKKDKTHNKT